MCVLNYISWEALPFGGSADQVSMLADGSTTTSGLETGRLARVVALALLSSESVRASRVVFSSGLRLGTGSSGKSSHRPSTPGSQRSVVSSRSPIRIG